jgi:hypothetical protein
MLRPLSSEGRTTDGKCMAVEVEKSDQGYYPFYRQNIIIVLNFIELAGRHAS